MVLRSPPSGEKVSQDSALPTAPGMAARNTGARSSLATGYGFMGLSPCIPVPENSDAAPGKSIS